MMCVYVSLLCRFYRSNAIDFCRQQVSVDTFLFSSQYQDVATLGTTVSWILRTVSW